MKKLTAFIKQQSTKKLVIIGTVTLVVLAFMLNFVLRRTARAVSRQPRPSGEQVSVATASSLSPNNAALPVIGKVESENDATILAETAGEIVTLNYQLGDNISAGDVIATMENSSQKAAVAQAQGTYDAAAATLAKVSGTTAENSTVTSTQATETAQNAQASAAAALQSTYAALDDAVHTKADVLFNDPRGGEATLSGTLGDYDQQLAINIEAERNGLEALLTNAESLTTDTATEDTDSNIATMLKDAQSVEGFLNDLIKYINEQTPTSSLSAATISGYQTSIGAARIEVVNAVSTLATARSTYDSDAASATSATNTADTGTESDIAVAQANVQSAEGALDAAKAALDKTIITSPISGTIINLPVTSGDYVSAYSTVAEISNPNALKVVAYVTGDEAQTLSVGNQATIENSISGIITHIAPAINPQTGTIEVDIGITGDESSLLDGDSVTVLLDRTTSETGETSSNPANPAQIVIPIVALKITPTGPVVFTVDAASKTLISHPVTIGSILGEDIVVTSGMTSDMVIVTDARGLTDKENVTVKE